MGRRPKARTVTHPDICPVQWVWMGSGAVKLEDGTRMARIDKTGSPFSTSWRWLMLHASHVIGGQLLTVDQYEHKHGKIVQQEG